MNSNSRIVFIHSHFLYWMGGTKYIYELLKKVSKQHKVIVIVENTSNHTVEQYRKVGIELINLNKLTSNSLFYWLTLPWQIYLDSIRIRNLISDDDILVVGMFPMNVVIGKICNSYNQLCFEPFAFFHDPEFTKGFSFAKRLGLKLLGWLYKYSDLKYTKKSSRVITLNKVTQKSITRVYGRTSIPIYTGIDTLHFRPYVSSQIYRLYKNDDIIIHSTDYTPVKRTQEMIEIFSAIALEFPRSKLLITSTINNQKEEDRLKTIANNLGVSSRVIFLGFVDYSILPQLYSVAKVLVQCSYSENSGTTSMALPVKEALACGTLCIRSPITDEDVIDNVTGYLVDPRDISGMVAAIRKTLTMSEVARSKAGKIARERIVREYTWEKTTERFIRIITRH